MARFIVKTAKCHQNVIIWVRTGTVTTAARINTPAVHRSKLLIGAQLLIDPAVDLCSRLPTGGLHD